MLKAKVSKYFTNDNSICFADFETANSKKYKEGDFEWLII